MSAIRTPLGRARGMGSAKHGVGHFIAQRVTGDGAGAAGALGRWPRPSRLAHGDYDGAADWLRSPLNAGLAVLLVVRRLLAHAARHADDHRGLHPERPATKARPAGAQHLRLLAGAARSTIFAILKVAFSAAGVSV